MLFSEIGTFPLLDSYFIVISYTNTELNDAARVEDAVKIVLQSKRRLEPCEALFIRINQQVFEIFFFLFTRCLCRPVPQQSVICAGLQTMSGADSISQLCVVCCSSFWSANQVCFCLLFVCIYFSEKTNNLVGHSLTPVPPVVLPPPPKELTFMEKLQNDFNNGGLGSLRVLNVFFFRYAI